MRTVASPTGTAGILTPTGLATDKTTAPFFSDTLAQQAAIRVLRLRERSQDLPGCRSPRPVRSHDHDRCAADGSRRTRFAFLTRHIPDVPSRRFALAPDEVLKMNPNTGTLPMFRTRVDADITLGIYDRHPVLIRDDDPDGNPWGLSFGTLFHMANDSGLFQQPNDLTDAEFNGWSYQRDGKEYVPLYEAKMLSHFDHRFSTYRGATQAQLNVGSLPRPSDAEHDDPAMEPLARYWVDHAEVAARLRDRWDRDWLLGWRDIARSSDSRTFVPSVLPVSAVGHKFPLALPGVPTNGYLLHSVWSSTVFDYVVRQKLSGTNMTYFILKQLACPTPDRFRATGRLATGTHPQRLGTSLRPRTLLHLVAIEALRRRTGRRRPTIPLGCRTPGPATGRPRRRLPPRVRAKPRGIGACSRLIPRSAQVRGA